MTGTSSTVLFQQRLNDWNLSISTCPDGEKDHVHVIADDGFNHYDLNYDCYWQKGNPIDILQGIYKYCCALRLQESMQHKILTLTAGVHIDN